MFTLIFTFLYYIQILYNPLRFTRDIPVIIGMRSDIKNLFTERELKNRIARIIKKLANSDLDYGSSSTYSCSVDVQETQPSNFNYIFIHINNKIDNKQ